MFPSVALIATASLYLLSAVEAVPSKRQADGDNGACDHLFKACASAVNKDLHDVYAINSCVFAATCSSGQRPLDNFIGTLYANKNGLGKAPQTAWLPRVSTSVCTNHFRAHINANVVEIGA